MRGGVIRDIRLDGAIDDHTVEPVGRAITVPYQLAEVIQDLIPIIVVREVVTGDPEVSYGEFRSGVRFEDTYSKFLCRGDLGHPDSQMG